MPTRALRWGIVASAVLASFAFASEPEAEPGAAAEAQGSSRYCLDGICRSTCILKTCLWISTSRRFGIIEAENGFNVPIGVRVFYDELRNVTSYAKWQKVQNRPKNSGTCALLTR